MQKIHLAWRRFRALPEIVQFGAVLALAIVLMVLWPSGARADSIARRGEDWVRLTLKPCTDARVTGFLQERGLDPLSMRAGVAHLGGQDFAACWMPAQGGAALVYSDGDQGFIPIGELKAAPEA